MTNHPFAEDLSAYVEGDLPEAKRIALERRLEADEGLRAELESMVALRQALRELPDPEVPFGLSTRVMARIQDGEAEPARNWFAWLNPSKGWFSPVATAACGFAAAALLFGTDLGNGLLQPTGDPTQIAASEAMAPYRTPRQQRIPGVSNVRTGQEPGRVDSRLTDVPRATQPTRPAAKSTASSGVAVADTAVAAPSPRRSQPRQDQAAAIEPRPAAPQIVTARLATEASSMGSSAADQVAYGDTLEFRSCLIASPSTESGCEETYQRWFELARDDEPAFQIELGRVPAPTRGIWLRQLNAYAQRAGESYQIPLDPTTPSRNDVPRKLDVLNTFGPNGR